MAQWLWSLNAQLERPIDVHACNEYAFRYVCERGRLPVAQWLWSLNAQLEHPIDAHVQNEEAFRWSCTNRHSHMVQWLLGVAKGHAEWHTSWVAVAQQHYHGAAL